MGRAREKCSGVGQVMMHAHPAWNAIAAEKLSVCNRLALPLSLPALVSFKPLVNPKIHYMLQILAHHPDLPSAEELQDDAEPLQFFSRMLQFALEALLLSSKPSPEAAGKPLS